MNHKLNDTYVVLKGLTDSQIDLTTALYKETGMTQVNRIPNDDYVVISTCPSNNQFGFSSGLSLTSREISFEELVFSSGLNPSWAAHVCRLNTGEYAWLETTLKGVPGRMQFVGEKTASTTTAKHKWYEAEEVANIAQIGKKNVLEPENKYEFVLKCKRTGNPVIADVYSVLKSLPQRLSPEVEHSVKKLMAAGIRNGGKSYKQDVEEARNQLNMEIKYLELSEKSNG